MLSKKRKKSDSKETSIVKCFSRVDLFVTICTKTVLKIALKKHYFPKKCFFFNLSSQNYTLKYKYSIIPLNQSPRVCK